MKRLSEFDSLILDLTPYQRDVDNGNIMEVPFDSDYIANLLRASILYIKVFGSSLNLSMTYFPAKRLVSPTEQSIDGYNVGESYSELIDQDGNGVTYRLTVFYKTGANAKFLLEEI